MPEPPQCAAEGMSRGVRGIGVFRGTQHVSPQEGPEPFPVTWRGTSSRGALPPWRALWFLLPAGWLELLPQGEDLKMQWSHWVSKGQGLVVALNCPRRSRGGYVGGQP